MAAGVALEADTASLHGGAEHPGDGRRRDPSAAPDPEEGRIGPEGRPSIWPAPQKVGVAEVGYRARWRMKEWVVPHGIL